MRISVIIPTYKPKEYLWECLESLAGQTLDRSHFEIILVLNGCNQPWAEEIKSWIQAHPDIIIKFIQTDQPGVSNARNIGLSNATGQFITFIDDDDYVSPEYLAALLNASKEDTVVLSDSRAFVDGIEGYKDSYTPHLAYQNCSKQNCQNILHARAIFNGPCMKLIPMSFIHGFSFDTTIPNGEDALFMFSISKNIKQLSYASAAAIYYRRYREASATTARKSKFFWIKNAISLNNKFLSAWLSAPLEYNIPFACNRLLANIKGLAWHLKANHLST